MKQVTKSIYILICWSGYVYGEILYFIEPYDFPDWYFNVKDNDIFSFYKNGLKFSIVKGLYGNPQYISFKLTNEKKYLRHQSFILRLHNIIDIWSPDAEFILQESNFPGFIKIKSTGSYSTRFLRFYGPNFNTWLEEKKDTNEYDMQTSFKFIASDSYTFYKFSAGVQNEFGMIVFGIASGHQTDEDFPTGPPLNFKVAQVNFSTLLLSWADVEYSKRKGIIQIYNYSCQDYEVSIWNNVSNSTFQVTVNNLKVGTTYNCSIAACTKVGCGVRSFGSNKTLEGIPQASAQILYISYINSSSIYVNWSDISTINWRVLQNRTFCIDIEKNDTSNLVKTKCVIYSPHLETYSTEIHGLAPFTKYSVLVYCTNEAGIGKKEVKEKRSVVTDQLAPAIPPKNLNFASVGVNNMLFQWDPLNESEYFGIIEGYSLVVKGIVEETDCMILNESLQPNLLISKVYNACAGLNQAKNITSPFAKSLNITNLFGNTTYMVSISANTKYQGVFSSGVYKRTAVGGNCFFFLNYTKE